MAVDACRHTDAPKRWRPPFGPGGIEGGAVVCQTFPHVMEQQVGIGVNDLIAQAPLAMLVAGGPCVGMTGIAVGLFE